MNSRLKSQIVVFTTLALCTASCRKPRVDAAEQDAQATVGTESSEQNARAQRRAVTPPTVPTSSPAGDNCETIVHAPSPRGDLRDLVLAGPQLLWRQGNSVMAWVRSSGPNGAKRTVLTDPRLRAMAADEQYVYVATDAGVFRAPLETGAPLERMLAPTGIMATFDDMMVNRTHLVVSRNFGEIVRIAKAPPFATQVFSQRGQRRNVFARWTVSDHAAWYSKPGRGLGSRGWLRLDLDNGAVMELPSTSRVYSNGSSVVLERNVAAFQPGLAITSDSGTNLFAVNETTGAIAPTPFWTGALSFGFAVGQSRVAFRTTVERADAGMPTMGWVSASLPAGPGAVLRRCARGTGLFVTMLDAVQDDANVYVIANDLQNGHRILSVPYAN